MSNTQTVDLGKVSMDAVGDALFDFLADRYDGFYLVNEGEIQEFVDRVRFYNNNNP